MGRGTSHVGTVPDAVQVGPKVWLINKYSASDGDLFPWGFRALGLGKLIGTRTWGGIVGISGSLQYMDGTDITIYTYIEAGTASDPHIIFNVLTDVGVIRKNLTITINQLPINVFYLTYNSINKPVSTYVNFNLNSSLGVTESTTCKLTYGNESATTIRAGAGPAGGGGGRGQTGTFFATIPLNMYITPKESSNILNRQNLYSGFVCMNFDDAYLYNSTPDELLS